MVKAKSTDESGSGGTATESSQSVMGYFRRIYKENPKLLKVRSNEEVFRRWLADHPENTEVPDKIKNGLANLKSILRSKKKKKSKAKAEAKAAASNAPSNGVHPLHISAAKLEGLEQQIDDCLALAKSLDREGLENVIHSLRRARNEIIRLMM